MFTTPSKGLGGRLTSVSRSLVATCLIIVVAGHAAAQSVRPSLTPGAEQRAKATILIHGLDIDYPDRPVLSSGADSPAWRDYRSINCTTYWSNWRGQLPQLAVTNIPVLTLGLYRNQQGCGASLSDMPDSAFAGGAGRRAYAENSLDRMGPTGEMLDTQVPIEALGYRLAWYVYSNYTVRGQSVNLVGHSMGGLVARYAVGGTHSGLAGFPPRLLVNTLVTVASPHVGTVAGFGCPSRQCRDLREGSQFISAVNFVDRTHSGVAKRLNMRARGDTLSSWLLINLPPQNNMDIGLAGTNVDYFGGRWDSPNLAYLHGFPKEETRLDRTDSMRWVVVNRQGQRSIGANGREGNRGTVAVPGTADGFYSLTVRRINQTTPDP